jgi:hypothetical protein
MSKTKSGRTNGAAALDDLLTESRPTDEQVLGLYLMHREQGKLHYAQADEALQELLQRLKGVRGKKLLTHAASGEVYELVDQFADRNTVFGHSGVRRFDLKLVKSKKPAATSND